MVTRFRNSVGISKVLFRCISKANSLHSEKINMNRNGNTILSEDIMWFASHLRYIFLECDSHFHYTFHLYLRMENLLRYPFWECRCFDVHIFKEYLCLLDESVHMLPRLFCFSSFCQQVMSQTQHWNQCHHLGSVDKYSLPVQYKIQM